MFCISLQRKNEIDFSTGMVNPKLQLHENSKMLLVCHLSVTVTMLVLLLCCDDLLFKMPHWSVSVNSEYSGRLVTHCRLTQGPHSLCGSSLASVDPPPSHQSPPVVGTWDVLLALSVDTCQFHPKTRYQTVGWGNATETASDEVTVILTWNKEYLHSFHNKQQSEDNLEIAVNV